MSKTTSFNPISVNILHRLTCLIDWDAHWESLSQADLLPFIKNQRLGICVKLPRGFSS